jgi:AAA family ATP:ADP antiporter
VSAIATGRLHAALRRGVDVRADETAALLVSFAYFFCVLSGWFVLRPIREATAAASGVGTLPYLFTGTLTVMLLANPVLSSLVCGSGAAVHRCVSLLRLQLLLFYAAALRGASAADLWIGRAFFVWTSVFNLFVVSIFWAFMADAFRSEQATRLFGFIAVGGTLGSVVGSATTAALAARIGTPNLMLVSAVLIELAVLCVVRFPARLGIPAEGESAAAEMPIGEVPLRARGDGPPIGGSIWAGITHVMRSPYLLGISALFVLFTIGSTTLYFQQADIVGRTYADRATRTTMLARLELVVQSLTLLTQLFFTGRLIRGWGWGRPVPPARELPASRARPRVRWWPCSWSCAARATSD